MYSCDMNRGASNRLHWIVVNDKESSTELYSDNDDCCQNDDSHGPDPLKLLDHLNGYKSSSLSAP